MQVERICPDAPLILADHGIRFHGLKVTVFLEVVGAAHYLPAFAGIRAYREVLHPETEIGINAQQNMSVSVTSSIVTLQEGAARVDVSLCGMWAGVARPPSRRWLP